MSRKVLDVITTTGGVVIVVVLVVAGGLLTWGHSFASTQRSQPAGTAADLLPAPGGIRPPEGRH